jgi:hypothetical protein
VQGKEAGRSQGVKEVFAILKKQGHSDIPVEWASSILINANMAQSDLLELLKRDKRYTTAGCVTLSGRSVCWDIRGKWETHITYDTSAATYKLRNGMATCDVSKTWLDKQLQDLTHATVAIASSDDKCFIAISELMGRSYNLFCLDKHSGNEVWRTKVWGPWPAGLAWYYGPACHDVVLKLVGSQLFVYGMTVPASYVEVFDPERGLPEFRFSTSGWHREE